MNRLRTWIVFALLATAFLLSSCSGDSVAEVVDEQVPAIVPASGAVEGSGPQGPRTELEATDPNSVALGSGKVTLVEFFAFW